MTPISFNPDNLIFFYLTATILLLAIAIFAHATWPRGKSDNKKS